MSVVIRQEQHDRIAENTIVHVPLCLRDGMGDAVIWGGGRSGMVVSWWYVIVVGLSALDLNVVVENGDDKTLRTVDVYDVGISRKNWGETISWHWTLIFWSIQGVLGYSGLQAKVCLIRFGALRDQTIRGQSVPPLRPPPTDVR